MVRVSSVLLSLGLVAASATPGLAMCIENRSDRSIAFVRSAPFDEMPVLFQGTVPPRGFQCSSMPLRDDGTVPVSVYVIDDRGRCKVATGCYYENADDQNVFVGAGTDGCAASFNVSYCR